MLTVFVVPRYFLFPTKLANCVATQKHNSPLSQGLMFKSDLSVSIFEEPQHVCILVKTFITLGIWRSWKFHGSLVVPVACRLTHSPRLQHWGVTGSR